MFSLLSTSNSYIPKHCFMVIVSHFTWNNPQQNVIAIVSYTIYNGPLKCLKFVAENKFNIFHSYSNILQMDMTLQKMGLSVWAPLDDRVGINDLSCEILHPFIIIEDQGGWIPVVKIFQRYVFRLYIILEIKVPTKMWYISQWVLIRLASITYSWFERKLTNHFCLHDTHRRLNCGGKLTVDEIGTLE